MPPASALKPEPSIGVLDSGVGGLSVLREIHALLPSCPTLYYADQAHLPYGVRRPDDIRALVEAITRFLVEQGAAMIVLACNAASAASLHPLRQRFPHLPFVGMEPAVKPAAEATHTGVIGVLTTQATAEGELYRRVVERYASHVRVITQVAPELVQIVEANSQHMLESQRVIRAHVAPLVAAGADQITLACTHFPFLKPSIQQIVGEGVDIIDPAPAIARQVARVLPSSVAARNIPNRYFTSGDPDLFRALLHDLIGVDAPVTAALLQG